MDNIEKIEVALPVRKFNADKKDIQWHDHFSTPGIYPGWQGMLPGEVSSKLRSVADYVDDNMEPYPADSNMRLALELAEQLAPTVTVPPSIKAMSPNQQADLILDVVKWAPRHRLPVNLKDHEPFVHIAKLIGTVGRLSRPRMLDIVDALERVSILLRMWSGCLVTQKTIANATRSGPNTKLLREQNARQIETAAARDPAFEAGMPAAMIIKLRESKARGTTMYSFDGIPPDTRVYELQKLIPVP